MDIHTAPELWMCFSVVFSPFFLPSFLPYLPSDWRLGIRISYISKFHITSKLAPFFYIYHTIVCKSFKTHNSLLWLLEWLIDWAEGGWWEWYDWEIHQLISDLQKSTSVRPTPVRTEGRVRMVSTRTPARAQLVLLEATVKMVKRDYHVCT